MRAATWIAAALATCALGCVNHITPYKPKHRDFDAGAYAAAPKANGSSLWSDGQGGFFDDNRASRIGDILVVRIDESDTASRDDSTDLEKSSSSDRGVGGLLPALATKAYPGVSLDSILSTHSESSFSGSGKVQRKGHFEAILPVRIKKVLPNGDFYVEGTKVVLIGHEEQHLYVSGVVRATDVGPDNSVLSSRIAEAEIEMSGRGDSSDQQRPGWASRFLSTLWPF